MVGNLLMSISQDERERAVFRSRRMYQTDYESDMVTSWDNGKQEGKREGKIEGKIEVAQSMLADGEPVDKISMYTGLTREEINRICSENC